MTRTTTARLRTDGITRRGLALKDERDALYAQARGRCAACGKLVEYTLFQVAHRIANTKANRRRFGSHVIDNPLNKAVTHPGRCNDRMNCGMNPAKCAEIVQAIDEERRDL